MPIKEFAGNDRSYLDWLARCPSGYVINTDKKKSPTYMILHRANCIKIGRYLGKGEPGGFTERKYVKVFGDTIQELSAWVRANGRSDGSFSKKCAFCDPC
jgi:hypothetical protein